jgi:hypothetical protein
MNATSTTRAALALAAALTAAGGAHAGPTPLVGIGDSLGEGVQSANAFAASQPNSYLNRVATQMGVPFAQPLMSTSPLASVFYDAGRARLSPGTEPVDLAVSGATTLDVLAATASAGPPTTEADLVLAPYVGESQVDIAQALSPRTVLAWVGNDDLISEVLNFDTLGSQDGVTPLPVFTAAYQALVARLAATGAQVVLANIPDLTQIGYLFDNDDLTKYTGIDYGLPAGTVTTLPTMLLLKLGVFDAGILADPDFVLDASQLAAIRTQVQAYNAVIAAAGAAAGYPVVDAFSEFDNLAAHPITIDGVAITTHYNGGAFSLDGVHPSDTGYAVFANAFIRAANGAYGLGIPAISPAALAAIAAADPFVDFGGHGVVRGRPFTGLLESLAPFLGLSGGEGAPTATIGAAEFMRRYHAARGEDPSLPFTRADVVAAVRVLVGAGRAPARAPQSR